MLLKEDVMSRDQDKQAREDPFLPMPESLKGVCTPEQWRRRRQDHWWMDAYRQHQIRAGRLRPQGRKQEPQSDRPPDPPPQAL